jgi:hypothetical protein
MKQNSMKPLFFISPASAPHNVAKEAEDVYKRAKLDFI